MIGRCGTGGERERPLVGRGGRRLGGRAGSGRRRQATGEGSRAREGSMRGARGTGGKRWRDAGAKGRSLRAAGVAKGRRRLDGAGAGTRIPSSESRWRRKKGAVWTRQRVLGRTPWRPLRGDRKAVRAVLGPWGGVVRAARSALSDFRRFRLSAQGRRGVRMKEGGWRRARDGRAGSRCVFASGVRGSL